MERSSIVNLNVNPCKMCMPMGGVMAFKGIENCMTILHGSQGCSTYIRRHMATHYNEPIDIASSSLSENGTVYGGAENLKIGLKNIIKLYKPKVIGVMTTCLAETIGENTKGIIAEFKEENKEFEPAYMPQIIPISTPGYGGTEAEGYYNALRGITEFLAKDDTKNNKINIICGNVNPGDVRCIKKVFDSFGVDYILLPDVSDTLDCPYSKEYKKIPEGGSKISDISKMAGAIATIEMGLTLQKEYSPGNYLNEKYKIPLYKCPIPIGIENTDSFLKLISEISGKSIPKEYKAQRGRYIDAMIDSHKYNGEGRAAIFGEPELVYAIAKLCFENGIKPLLIATGSQNEKLKELLKSEIKEADEEITVLNDVDFDIIENYIKKKDINVMIGNSDGRRIEKRLEIPLIRIGFPIHDRVGAQRQVFTCYEGSLTLLDSITNSLLERKANGFRKEMFDKYYTPVKGHVVKVNNKEKTLTHPCYNACAHEYARMHIPVAPNCNISCNYCSRDFDCPNESRPGVTSEILNPEEALEKFKIVKEKVKNMTVVGIAGPGDALANFETVKKSIELIKNEDPSVTFCLSTNGLMLPFYANELIALDVSHVTVTINTINPEIGARVYKEINYLGTKYTGIEAAKIILNNQLSGLKYLTSKGVVCKVNLVMVKGVNDSDIENTVKKVKECGAFMTNIMQMIPASGSVFEKMPLVSNQELNDMRKKCEVNVKQMYHCKQCRADAIGMLSEDVSLNFRKTPCSTKELSSETEYKFAVASKSGVNIDAHFGHVDEFYIYKYTDGIIEFIEKRKISKYCSGPVNCDELDKEDKIESIINSISDCDSVLVMRIGDEPSKKLKKMGISVFQMYEEIKKGIAIVTEKIQKKEEEVL